MLYIIIYIVFIYIHCIYTYGNLLKSFEIVPSTIAASGKMWQPKIHSFVSMAIMDDIFWGLHNRAEHVCSCSGAIWNSTLGPSPLLEFALPTSSDLQCTCHSLSLLLIPFPVAQRMKLGVLRLWFPHVPCNKRLYKSQFD